jgi:hypothetical protein
MHYETKELKLQLTAHGNSRQLASILREAAEKIEYWDAQKQELPWFVKVGGSIMYNWEVVED